MDYHGVLDFWFRQTKPKQWWKKDPAFDRTIARRFCDLHAQASRGELFPWRQSPEGRLAEIIVLDQFSRNIFRDSSRAYACDGVALVLAQEAVNSRDDFSLAPVQRSFLYMPYMHSESLTIHVEAVRLYEALGIENNLDFELRHKAIIERFGRYPHRNQLLARESTREELEFLSQPGSSF